MVKNSAEVRYLIRVEDLRKVTVTRNIDSGTETVHEEGRGGGGAGGKLGIIWVENGSM